MDLMSSSFLPGDPRMVDQIVYELKSQGIFDQFRKECIADVDTKPAYQNLRQRVEGSVMNFLKKRKFASDTNKNQLREQLRKNITESGFLESGVERIVDQVVNPKISSVFLPKVEEVVYRFLGIQKPESAGTSQNDKVKSEDLLPTDLEAVSPESVHETSNVSAMELSSENVESTNNETNNTSLTKTDDESPPFEPLEENTKLSMQEDNSVDSRYSGASGNDSVLGPGNQSMDISENSQFNGNSNLASLEDVKMDICDNTMASENSDKLEIVEEPKETKCSEQKTEEKHKNDSNKRSHDKYPKSSKSDKHREDSKDKRERSKSESKSKEKSSSKHPTSSSKDKNKKEEPNEKEFNLEKYKIPKKEDNDKNKDSKPKSEKSGERDKSNHSDKSSKERTKSERDRHDKERSNSHKSKERSSSSSKKDDKDRKHREERDDKSSKDKNASSSKSSSSSKNKESSSKDRSSKDKPRSSSSSKDKEKTSDSKRTHDDSKSSKRDKHKGHESSSKKEKEKSVSDDHYSFKNKKRERRSTDRDSNDGSGKTNQNESLVDSTSENSSKSSKKGTSENFSSGGDSSSNSDKVEKCNEAEEVATSTDVVNIQPIKYIKPKFASNMEEAMKIMKIRKQLAKLERENQLALSQIPKQTALITTEPAESESAPEIATLEIQEKPREAETPVLKSQDLSMETFEALEARLAQEMSNIGEHMYGDEDDENYECSISASPIKKRKLNTETESEEELKELESTEEGAIKDKLEEAAYVVKKVKFNGSLENVTTNKSLNSSDKENHIIESENRASQTPKRKEEFTGFTAAERKRSEEIIEKVVKAYSQYMTGKTAIPTQNSSAKLVTTPKTIDNRLFIKLNKIDLKPSGEIKFKQNGDISSIEEDDEPCYFFRKDSLLVSEKRLAILNQYVVRLERHVEEKALQIQKNVSHIIKRGVKSKLQGTENNNSLNCNYKPPTKRNHLSNANSNETVCNTNVSSHPDFSLPLSPAESEKSGENKKEEPVMVKPKRVSGSATKRYSSADLYKPRPVLSGSSTRRRSARTCLDAPKP